MTTEHQEALNTLKNILHGDHADSAARAIAASAIVISDELGEIRRHLRDQAQALKEIDASLVNI